MTETQQSISEWAEETFGPVASPFIARSRAIIEMEEFKLAFEPDTLMDEAADIVICLYRLADLLGRDLHVEIDRKMAVNRSRKWHRFGDGTGAHV